LRSAGWLDGLAVAALGPVSKNRAQIVWAGQRFTVPVALTARRRVLLCGVAKLRRALAGGADAAVRLELALVDARPVVEQGGSGVD
jgi:hypothetical protein